MMTKIATAAVTVTAGAEVGVPGDTAAEGNVLVVDDDQGVRTVVSWQLEAAGYTVVQAADGLAALAALTSATPDLLVLDIMLPRLDGFELLRRIRAGETACPPDAPVIVLSGRSMQTDRIEGLDLGADDYLVKPFSPGELAARVRSVLRRSGRTHEPSAREAGRIRVDEVRREVRVDGTPVTMTAREFDLLAFLVAHPLQVFSRAQLLARVWQSSASWQGEATVTEHVHRLRNKVEVDPSRPVLVRTVRGVGYQLDPT